MSIDHILDVKTPALDGGGNSTGTVGDDLSVSLGIGDPAQSGPGLNDGASVPSSVDGGSNGVAQIDLAAGTPSPGGDDPAALRYYAGLSPPVSISLLPQSAKSDRNDGASGTVVSGPFAAAPAGGSTDSFSGGLGDGFGGGLGDDSSQSGSPAIDLSAKGGPGGGGSGGGSGGGTPPPYTASLNGMTFVVNFDSSVGSAPKGFVSGFESAVQYFLTNLAPTTAPITITIDAGWGEVAGTRLSTFALGESSTNIDRTTYSALQGSSMGAYLPASDPVSATHTYWVASAEEKALGLVANNSNLDGAVGFSSRVTWNFNSTTSSGQYDFVSVAEHEISETMGRIGLGGGTVSDNGTLVSGSYTPFDLFRYSAPGVPAPTAGTAAYFSFDGGNSSGATNLAGSLKTDFNTIAGGDISDWASSTGNDAFNAFSSSGVAYHTSSVDKLVMDVLGYGTVAPVA